MEKTISIVPSLNPGKTVTPSIWQMISTIAPVIHKSKLFGVTTSEAAMAIMLKGYELGMGLTAAFDLINVVQGRPALSPRGALALILQSGELESMVVDDQPGQCTVHMKRKNGLEYGLTFTMDDAKKTGQVKPNSAWETYPANMLRWRAIGFVADVVFPDIIGGMKRADEFGASIDEEGNVIEGSWSATEESQPSATAIEEAAPTPTLDELVAQYGAEQVVAANEGKIPGNDAEVASVARKLQEAAHA